MFEKLKEKAKEMWKDGKPKKWYYGIPIIIIWVIVLIVIIKKLIEIVWK
jgi:hypothetical protein